MELHPRKEEPRRIHLASQYAIPDSTSCKSPQTFEGELERPSKDYIESLKQAIRKHTATLQGEARRCQETPDALYEVSQLEEQQVVTQNRDRRYRVLGKGVSGDPPFRKLTALVCVTIHQRLQLLYQLVVSALLGGRVDGWVEVEGGMEQCTRCQCYLSQAISG
uniref:CACTA en-spm transposon protein n=1 Tax=Mesocestoides corti TaxID=53468 RepID=A0A5K3EIQ3_MESCO